MQVDHRRPAMVEGLEDRIPGAWLGPMLDASKVEGLTRWPTLTSSLLPAILHQRQQI